MAKLEFDTGVTGSNLAIGEPLAWAMRTSGYATSDPTQPTDLDLGSVTETDKVLDLAELRLLENMQSNNDLVDREDATVRWAYGQIARNLQQRIAAMQQKVKDLYGFALPTAFSHGMRRIDGYSELASE